MDKCPICGEGPVAEVILENEYITYMSFCNSCGSDFATSFQMKLNKDVKRLFDYKNNHGSIFERNWHENT